MEPFLYIALAFNLNQGPLSYKASTARNTMPVKQPGVLKLYMRRDGVEGEFHCVGIVVSPRTVLTASHCIEQVREIWAVEVHNKKKRIPLTVVKFGNYMEGQDWAFLEGAVTPMTTEYPVLSPRNPTMLERVVAITYDGGTEHQIVWGGYYLGRGELGHVISAYVIPGESGSPLLDQSGAVIGVITKTVEELHIGVATAVDTIVAGLKARGK